MMTLSLQDGKDAISGQDSRSQLMEIIREKSFSDTKQVTLSSGRVSNLYFNMKPTMLDNRASLLIAQLLLGRIGKDADFVGGLEMGAVPIVSALCPVAAMSGQEIRTFFVRKKAKEHGARKLIEGLTDDEDLQGKKVVVVDDVTTTGQSVVSTFKTLESLGATIVKVISVVDREEGAAELFEKQGIVFESLFKASDFTH